LRKHGSVGLANGTLSVKGPDGAIAFYLSHSSSVLGISHPNGKSPVPVGSRYQLCARQVSLPMGGG